MTTKAETKPEIIEVINTDHTIVSKPISKKNFFLHKNPKYIVAIRGSPTFYPPKNKRELISIKGQ